MNTFHILAGILCITFFTIGYYVGKFKGWDECHKYSINKRKEIEEIVRNF